VGAPHGSHPVVVSGVPSLRFETVIAAPAAACFELSLCVDAHTASMSGSNERAIAGVTSGTMALGDTVTWRAWHLGVLFRMTSQITAYEAPRRFVDEQLRGPFDTWWHEHTFTALDTGDTAMVDVVRFKAPLGPVGTLVEQLALTGYLKRLLQRRNDWLKDQLENSHPS
jgi:ligand-binding SRPBCC domain-containing protein